MTALATAPTMERQSRVGKRPVNLPKGVTTFIAVKWLLRYVQTHTFNAIGWYRIALAAAIFLFLLH